MSFFLLSLCLALVATAPLLLPLVRAQRGEALPDANTDAARGNLATYRLQIAEVSRDLERGVITPSEAEQMRTEIARRLLSADNALQAAKKHMRVGPSPQNALPAFALLALVLGAAFGGYHLLGAPGYSDLPLSLRKQKAAQARANRPSQRAAEAAAGPLPEVSVGAETADVMARLREAVAQRPNDLRGHEFLATNEARIGRFRAAAAAQKRVIALKDHAQTNAQDYALLAHLLVLSTGGYVSPQAESALNQALSRQRDLPLARYYKGLSYAQTGRPDIAFQLWRALLETGPQDGPWLPLIRARLPELAERAGVRYEMPAAPLAPPPNADAAASILALPAEDRAAQARAMVARLGDRLAREGGSAEEWARLIFTLSVLDENAQARAIFNEAQQVFSAHPEDLRIILQAAEKAGISK